MGKARFQIQRWMHRLKITLKIRDERRLTAPRRAVIVRVMALFGQLSQGSSRLREGRVQFATLALVVAVVTSPVSAKAAEPEGVARSPRGRSSIKPAR